MLMPRYASLTVASNDYFSFPIRYSEYKILEGRLYLLKSVYSTNYSIVC